MEFCAVRCSELFSIISLLFSDVVMSLNTHDLVVVNRCSLDVVVARSILVLVVGVPLEDCYFVFCK